jgi:hypothetical protein
MRRASPPPRVRAIFIAFSAWLPSHMPQWSWEKEQVRPLRGRRKEGERCEQLQQGRAGQQSE